MQIEKDTQVELMPYMLADLDHLQAALLGVGVREENEAVIRLAKLLEVISLNLHTVRAELDLPYVNAVQLMEENNADD